MTHTELMDLAEKMGSEATESEARAMANILSEAGYSVTATSEIPEDAWLRMVGQAVETVRLDA